MSGQSLDRFSYLVGIQPKPSTPPKTVRGPLPNMAYLSTEGIFSYLVCTSVTGLSTEKDKEVIRLATYKNMSKVLVRFSEAVLRLGIISKIFQGWQNGCVWHGGLWPPFFGNRQEIPLWPLPHFFETYSSLPNKRVHLNKRV